MEVFLSLIKSGTCTKIISKLYNAIQSSKQKNTKYIKKKWEKETMVLITLESWEKISQLQWLSTDQILGGSSVGRIF